MADYSLVSKTLHFMALQSSAVRRIAFDLDCLISCGQKTNKQLEHPVFITGLARAGTTVLLEALFSTGQFTTLTYRDMPFVTAPLTWSLLTKGHFLDGKQHERAHGDGLQIGFDSPEAFEEVFWMTFSRQAYVHPDRLDLQVIDEEVIEKYRNFVKNIISRCEAVGVRYLAKNNNNLLRIPCLKQAFPNGKIIVPFRHPGDHVRSLQTQHKKFCSRHKSDSYSLRYMNWLGHFEFGDNFKPFNVSANVHPGDKSELNSSHYWFRYWTSVYRYVLEKHSSDVIFFDYDDFCSDPQESLQRLGEVIFVEPTLLMPFCSTIKKNLKPRSLSVDSEPYKQSMQLYAMLKAQSLQSY